MVAENRVNVTPSLAGMDIVRSGGRSELQLAMVIVATMARPTNVAVVAFTVASQRAPSRAAP
jgi:hypothetical protein